MTSSFTATGTLGQTCTAALSEHRGLGFAVQGKKDLHFWELQILR